MKPLTPRELACLKWVAIGKTSWETGRILGLAERTINFHIQNACRKLGVHGRQAAITQALRSGLLTFDEPPDQHSPAPLSPATTVKVQVHNTAVNGTAASNRYR